MKIDAMTKGDIVTATASPISQIDDLPELSTRPQLAEFTGVSIPTLARWAVEKTGPRVTKLGTAVRYRKADVIAWLEESAA